MIPPNPDSPTIVDAPAPEKKPRRRLTPEQRIAEAEAVIAREKEKRREAVAVLLREAKEKLRTVQTRATEAGMTDVAKWCGDALRAFEPPPHPPGVRG